MKESEFGKGLSYCLGLFLAHGDKQEYLQEEIYGDRAYGLWFNGAGDHLYELEIPAHLTEKLQIRIKEFRDKVIKWRLEKPTLKDWQWAVGEAKSLLYFIDLQAGIDAIRAKYG